MKKFFNWLEDDVTRGRRVVLLGTIFVYITITIVLFVAPLVSEFTLKDNMISLYMVFTGLTVSVYGFYTGTSSDKSSDIADKAADLLMTKMDEYNVPKEESARRR